MIHPVADYSRSHVLIVGDVMLDRYWHGSTSRISPEAPVPVVRVEGDEFRAGGAGNVALNVATLGARASLVGLVGEDASAQMLRERLEAAGVNCGFVAVSGCHTITKLRILSRHQQLIRLDFEDGFSGVSPAQVSAAVAAHLDNAGALVLSDYAKGALADAPALIAAARARGLPVVVDPKGSDFRPYSGATVITPNLSEFEAVVGRCADESTLLARGCALRDELGLAALLITRSERGMTLLERDRAPLNLPTHAREVYDVTGAGDTVVALLAAGLAAGQTLAEATAIANLGAGVVVGKLGTATVSCEELRRAQRSWSGMHHGSVDGQHLTALLDEARAAGETVVLVAGSFDGLRPADLKAVNAAREAGDRVVAAVSGKGDFSFSLAERLALASALEGVDWAVASDEPPSSLTQRLGITLVSI